MKSFARLWKMECRKALGNRFFCYHAMCRKLLLLNKRFI